MRPLADIELKLSRVRAAQNQVVEDLTVRNFQGQLLFQAGGKAIDDVTISALVTILHPLLPAIKSLVLEELKKNHDTVMTELRTECEKLLTDVTS